MQKNILILLIIFTTLFLASCENKPEENESVEASQNIVSDKATSDNGISSENIEFVQKYFSDSFSYTFEEADLTVEEIYDDLGKHTDLIPGEPVLGGTFYYNDIIVLNSNMLYANAEDGHINCEMFFGYEVKNKKITWELIAYNFNDEGLTVVK